jgi:energy-coupling factor transporter ATP-binding protein EcfA2
MLHEVAVQNFKIHRNTSVSLAQVTVFIGPNSSGKSSLFQSLLLLKQATAVPNQINLIQRPWRNEEQRPDPYLYPNNFYIDVGEFEDILLRGESRISIEVVGAIHTPPAIHFQSHVALRLKLTMSNNRLGAHSGQIETTYGRWAWEWAQGTPNRAHVSDVKLDGVHFDLSPTDTFQLTQAGSISWPNNFPQTESQRVAEFVQFLAQVPTRFFNSLHHIYPLRGFEESGYALTDYPAEGLNRILLGDRTAAILSVLAYNSDLQERLSDWLERLVGLQLKVRLLPRKRVVMQCRPSGRHERDTLFSNEGSGANQLPFLLVPIGLAAQGDSLMISEPEAHLHPKLQSALAGLIAKLAVDENRQFLIETHSEHILHALLNAVATKRLTTDQLAIFYFENKKGIAEVRKLDVDEKGRVDGGLPGFFDHSLTELSQTLEALKNR